MSNKENEKESTKEKDKEIHHHQQCAKPKRIRSSYSDVCFGKFKAKLVYDTAERNGMSTGEANCWMDFMDEIGWRFKDGTEVDKDTFARSLRMWHKVQPAIEAKAISMLHKRQRRAPIGCDCDNCRHQECCGGPQYGCVPDYYPEHFGAGVDADDD